METNISKKALFNASCIALTVTAMTFAIRAGILVELGVDFNLNNKIVSKAEKNLYIFTGLQVIQRKNLNFGISKI